MPEYRPRGYKTCFHAEHEMCPANKSQITNNCHFFLSMKNSLLIKTENAEKAELSMKKSFITSGPVFRHMRKVQSQYRQLVCYGNSKRKRTCLAKIERTTQRKYRPGTVKNKVIRVLKPGNLQA